MVSLRSFTVGAVAIRVQFSSPKEARRFREARILARRRGKNLIARTKTNDHVAAKMMHEIRARCARIPDAIFLSSTCSRLLLGMPVFRLPRSSGIREGRQERAAIRTWTLDALRAATEPVKVEAMQAIVEVGLGKEWLVCAGWRACCQICFCTLMNNGVRHGIETPRDSETHAAIGPSDPSLPTETGWISRAGGTESQED